MIVAPTLTTARLTLRCLDRRDWPAYRTLMGSERARYVGGPYSAFRAYQLFSTEVAQWILNGFGPWAVCRTGEEESIGLVSLFFPEGWPERELGWLLWNGKEGAGYATEAALAARAWAYGPGGWDSAVSYIDPENARSVALAERLGAVRDDDATPLEPGDLVYRHPPPEAGAA